MTSKLGSLKVIQQTNKINTATVIFFHGSGDTGAGLLQWINFLIGDFSYPHIKFLFPTAPLQAYTPMNGELSHVWFDRYDIRPDIPEHEESLVPIDMKIKELIDIEVKQGVPLNKIIVGGFSMGGALALHTAYRNVPGLAGTFTLSSFLNTNSSVYKILETDKKSLDTPFIMFHGDHDTLVPQDWGKMTYNNLIKYNLIGEYHIVKNCFHELKKSEIKQLFEWIRKILPDNKEP